MAGPCKTLIGMIHAGALPGTPRADTPIRNLVDRAVEEARTLRDAGFRSLLLENMHDRPYLYGTVGPEITAAMTALAVAVRAAVPDAELGVQVLAAANVEAIAVALASGASFVRAENFAFAQVADEGLMARAEAGPLLRYRRQIGADAVRIVADVKKKHAAHAVTADLSLAEAARACEFFGADVLVVSGVATGRPAAVHDVAEAKSAVAIPVWVGSGVTPENLESLWPHADGFIVGSYLKHDGIWSNPIDRGRAQELVRRFRSLGGA